MVLFCIDAFASATKEKLEEVENEPSLMNEATAVESNNIQKRKM